jgi:hypothetical protein
MTAIHLHLKSDVGTTYKRALKRFHQSREREISRDFTTLPLIDSGDNWCVGHPLQGAGQMRKLRDYDSELKALELKARQLKSRRQSQLGELVIACGADALTPEELVGALMVAAGTSDRATKEDWRKRGGAFFSGERQSIGERAISERACATRSPGSTPSPGSEPGTA